MSKHGPLIQMSARTAKGRSALAAALASGDPEARGQAMAQLALQAEAFLRMGSSWSERAVLAMSQDERAAAVQGGERFRAAMALANGKVARGGRDEAEVAAVLDGGALLESIDLDEEAAMLREKLAGTPVDP